MALQYLSIAAAAASGLGFVHCTVGCLGPVAAPVAVEILDSATDQGIAVGTLAIAAHEGLVDTLRPVPGDLRRLAGRMEFPDGYTLTVTRPGYADFEDDHDVEDTGGCGLAGTTIVVRLTPAHDPLSLPRSPPRNADLL